MWLSKGPNPVVIKYKGYFINEFRFHTRKRDARSKTQNSGVTLFIFPKLGHPIVGKRRNKGKSFTLDHESLVQAHRYTLFNFEDKLVEEYIK